MASVADTALNHQSVSHSHSVTHTQSLTLSHSHSVTHSTHSPHSPHSPHSLTVLAVDKEEREIRMTVEATEEDATRVTILDTSNGTMYHTSENIVLFGLGLQSVEEISQLFPLKCCAVVAGDLEYFVFPHSHSTVIYEIGQSATPRLSKL